MTILHPMRSQPSNAVNSAVLALKVVDDLLSYMNAGKGKPSQKERAIFAASVVFTYGVWESFVEDLAIEIAEDVSHSISPDRVPDRIKKVLEASSTWELSVNPGWRRLWVNRVKAIAKGEGASYGMNTAGHKQVTDLFSMAGITAPFKMISTTAIPPHLSGTVKEITAVITALVTLRGSIVHSGAVPTALRKSHVQEWRQFIFDLVTELDIVAREAADKLVA